MMQTQRASLRWLRWNYHRFEKSDRGTVHVSLSLFVITKGKDIWLDQVNGPAYQRG